MGNFDITQIVTITGLGGLALIVLLYLCRDLIKGVLKDLFPKFDKTQAFAFLVLLLFVIFAIVVFAIFSNVRQNQVVNTNTIPPNNSTPQIVSPNSTPSNVSPSNTPPINFVGKFGIPLETDKELTDAIKNVQVKGKDKGFKEIYIFKDADGYKTVAIFNDAATAQENLSLAESVNPTANEVKSFKTWCSNPKWVKDDGYYNCSK